MHLLSDKPGSRTTGLKTTDLDQWFSVLVMGTHRLFICLPYWTHLVQLNSSLDESLMKSVRTRIERHWSMRGVKKISDFKILEHFKNCRFDWNFLFQFALFGIMHVCAERDESREYNPQHQQHWSDAFSSPSLFHSTSNTDRLSLLFIMS